MSSLQDLNTYSTNTITFTDNRPSGVILSYPSARNVNRVITVKTITLQRLIEIVEIIKPSIALVQFIVTVPVNGHTIDFGTLPAGCNLVTNGNTHTINGIDSVSDWDSVKAPTITLPDEFFGNFFCTATIKYYDNNIQQFVEVDWQDGIDAPQTLMESSTSMNVSATVIWGGETSLQGSFSVVTGLKDIFMVSRAGIEIDSRIDWVSLAADLPVVGSVDMVPTVTEAITPYLSISNPNNNTTSTNDNFGLHGITADSDYIVVGARLENDNSTLYAGVAYVFDVSNGNLVYTLENPQATTSDYFGFDVALTQNYIIIGANQEEGADSSDGAIYIYNKSNGTLAHTIESPAYSGNSYFGTNLDAIDYANDVIAVAAPGENKVYYNVQCSTGTLNAGNSITNPALFQPQISNPGNVFDAYNGWFIAGEATNYQAHIYQGSTLQYTLTETDVSTSTTGRFGSAVAISNSYYAVAGFNTNNGDGRVWVGRLSDGAILGEIDCPTEVGQDPGGNGNHRFGYNLQLTDDYLYITTETVVKPPIEGRVWVYDPATQTPIPQKKIYPPDSLLTGSSPLFAETIGSNRDNIVVASGKDGDGNDFVYAYNIE
jgi:hypothetical protein